MRESGWKCSVAALIITVAAVGAAAASAGDAVFTLNISAAMASADALSKLDGLVKFYFGNAQHPAVVRSFGDVVANERANAFAKSDVTACNRSFLSALIRLQRRAHAVGANAVVDIHSYYRKEDVSSETEIPCHTGFLMAGVALKGTLAKLADR